ncbi:MAG TPA: hypothetical protein VEG39_12185 [Clostridia bacterium]|nr:hypothetical protein [Clostridia bacterium]
MSELVMDCTKPEILLQKLIRFNTTNPPGSEEECIKYITGLLEAAGVETVLLHGDDPLRLNLVAKIKGQGIEAQLALHLCCLLKIWIFPGCFTMLTRGFL